MDPFQHSLFFDSVILCFECYLEKLAIICHFMKKTFLSASDFKNKYFEGNLSIKLLQAKGFPRSELLENTASVKGHHSKEAESSVIYTI